MKNVINVQTKEKSLISASTTSKPNGVKKYIRSIQELSKMGFSGYGVKKVNQDNLFIVKNFMDEQDNIYMAVW